MTKMHKIFIDGQAGTTGLQIQDRLLARQDIELLSIDDADRKNTAVKKQILAAADVVILCLPDEAAIETAALVKDTDTRVLDASTAHRTDPDWAYGLAELSHAQRDKIKAAKYVSNPGCYPTGFLLAIKPLVDAGLLDPTAQLSISAVSGYSGGGHNMMDRYEARLESTPEKLWHSRPYALKFGHKHLPEMRHFAGLQHLPLFMPSVGHYAQGMLVSIPLAASAFKADANLDSIYQTLTDYYQNEPCVIVHGPNQEADLDQGFLDPEANNGSNRNDIYVFGNGLSGDDAQYMLVSQLDNLGKGAAGAAIQNLNIMLGVNELTGLDVSR